MNLKILIILGILIVIFIVGFFQEFSQELERPNVKEETNFSLDIETDQNNIDAYRDFIENNKEQYGETLSRADFISEILRVESYLATYPLGITAENLREKIVEELNIGFLLDGIDQRQLIVITTSRKSYENFTEEELLFKDPQVGAFSALLLVPQEEGVHPAVIGLHGHGDNSKSIRDRFGETLVRKGFVVIMPFFRAMNCDEIETAISEKLYLNGFTLMGLRIYETHLLIKYLRYKDFVDKNKIGIMGHSGGSDTAYLTSIISPNSLKALVFDMYPKLNSLCDEGRIHCETLPDLAYYTPQIKNSSALTIPHFKFEYGYSGEAAAEEIANFFKKKLTKRIIW